MQLFPLGLVLLGRLLEEVSSLRKLAVSLLFAATVVTTATAAASPYVPAPTRHPHQITTIGMTAQAQWAESKADSRGGGTFAQVPFNMSFNVVDPSYKAGTPVGLHFNIKTMEENPIFLRAPLSFKVQITNAKSKKVVWTGSTPALEPSEFPSWEKFMTLRFEWNQRDTQGRKLPAGKYHAEVVGPATISYSNAKQGKILKQKLRLDVVNRGGYDFVIKSK
jgi:hypothetical protein